MESNITSDSSRIPDRTPVITMRTEASELLIPPWDADLRQRATLDAPWIQTRCWIRKSASCWCLLRAPS
jgi:hypothetical protein